MFPRLTGSRTSEKVLRSIGISLMEETASRLHYRFRQSFFVE
jgi:hypothetical protein